MALTLTLNPGNIQITDFTTFAGTSSTFTVGATTYNKSTYTTATFSGTWVTGTAGVDQLPQYTLYYFPNLTTVSFTATGTPPDNAVGAAFLYGCDSLANIDIGSLPATAFRQSINTLSTSNLNAPSVVTGVIVTGTNFQAFLDRFDNSTYGPYRTLHPQGYVPPIPPVPTGEFGAIWVDGTDDEHKYPLQSQGDVTNLCSDAANPNMTVLAYSGTFTRAQVKAITITKVTGTSIPNNFLRLFKGVSGGENECDINLDELFQIETIVSIGDNFLRGSCFNKSLWLENITSIGINFLNDMPWFNQPLSLKATMADSSLLVGSNVGTNSNAFTETITFDTTFKISSGSNLLASRVFDGGIYIRSGAAVGNNCLSLLTGGTGPSVIIEAGATVGEYFLGGSTTAKSEATGKAIHIGDNATIGHNFLRNSKHNAEITIGSTVTIGSSFLRDNTAFNSNLTIGASTTIANEFMYNCTAFNSPITFTDVRSVGNNFMAGNIVFNQPLDVTSLTGAGTNFLLNCPAFNKPLTFNKLVIVNSGFLSRCGAFNSALQLPVAEKIYDNFLAKDSGASNMSFNQPLELPSIIEIGNSFMSECIAFNSILTLPNTLTKIGTNAFYRWNAFNKKLSFPESLTDPDSVGENLFYDANNQSSIGNLIIDIGQIPATVFKQSDNTFATTSATSLTYTNGINVIGDQAILFRDRFADRSVTPFRKLNYSKENALATLTYLDGTSSKSFEIFEDAEFVKLCNNEADTTSITIQGRTIVKNTIKALKFEAKFSATSIGNYFLYNCINFTNNDENFEIPPVVESIGSNFLGNCKTFNANIIFRGIKDIGANFLYSTDSSGNIFNSTISFPDSLRTIGEAFLADNKSFNKPINLASTNVSAIPNGFMKGLVALNATVTLPNYLSTIGNDYLMGDVLYNWTVNLPMTLVTIGNNFLRGCTGLRSQVNLPVSLTHIGNNFLYNCENYRNDITIPVTVTSIGKSFMFNCKGFTGTLNIETININIFDDEGNETFSTDDQNAPVFVVGYNIATQDLDSIKARFPDRSTAVGSPFRKTKLGSNDTRYTSQYQFRQPGRYDYYHIEEVTNQNADSIEDVIQAVHQGTYDLTGGEFQNSSNMKTSISRIEPKTSPDDVSIISKKYSMLLPGQKTGSDEDAGWLTGDWTDAYTQYPYVSTEKTKLYTCDGTGVKKLMPLKPITSMISDTAEILGTSIKGATEQILQNANGYTDAKATATNAKMDRVDGDLEKNKVAKVGSVSSSVGNHVVLSSSGSGTSGFVTGGSFLSGVTLGSGVTIYSGNGNTISIKNGNGCYVTVSIVGSANINPDDLGDGNTESNIIFRCRFGCGVPSYFGINFWAQSGYYATKSGDPIRQGGAGSVTVTIPPYSQSTYYYFGGAIETNNRNLECTGYCAVWVQIINAFNV